MPYPPSLVCGSCRNHHDRSRPETNLSTSRTGLCLRPSTAKRLGLDLDRTRDSCEPSRLARGILMGQSAVKTGKVVQFEKPWAFSSDLAHRYLSPSMAY